MDDLLCLALFQVLAHLLDMVFYSDEKERVIPLLVNLMHYVVPYLRNHRYFPFNKKEIPVFRSKSYSDAFLCG